MTAEYLEPRFFSVLATMLNIPRGDLSRESSRDSIPDWDSLRHMHLLLALEEEFAIEFSDDELARLRVAGDILNAIIAKINRNGDGT